ncbi:3D (Asp-Asp-Asp) domain-containing protein [Halobacillus karajensis]|uniref:Cell wall-binding protein YocH n=1 Tax=Halobacillus karajensis TaxID=195088 RepID=A0A024P1X6_9BACI|nr:3D domain-containing protein [Halobacillus karajensis]CDQ19586.1 Cell wall-binding protein YocH precursor [Halobacillus karajensis]CDQ22048.1 Cell wall-binding protein YocH precursor [Halobacillus karajensis]CDQ27889.1 Cell wall-binding protein YocH precursor [Halobacillus karajensis]SEH79878.1 3D (Asp-Asp-Asp) domain-containing protein [Halobacillus karajensis]
MKKTVISVAATVALTGAFATTVSAHETEYKINKGDTLWGISQKYDVSVNDLKTMNNLNSNLIYPNQTLKVANGSKSSTPSSSSNTSSNTSTYTVKSGDTLYAISQKFNISVDQLMAWNNLTSTLIHPGEQFKVDGQAAPATTAPSSNSSSNTSSATQTSTSKDTGNDVIKEITAEATAYTAYCSGCSGVTSTGIDLRANPDQKVIAVDPNVIPLGSKVYVEGYGTAIAGDTGGSISGNRIDVFMPSQEEALSFGRKSVKVQVLAN